jgi:mRNA interferase HigB
MLACDVHVISRKTLREFWKRHSDAEQPLKAWHAEAERALWSSPTNIKERYASASFLANDRVVFNIGGNKYRLVIAVKYQQKLIFVRFIGTHRDYDGIDAETI